ncbi:MAG: Hsp33 family molecular chaperone HslO [Limnohabitans sp.]
MSELHKFIFEGIPVRGLLVRLTDSWQDILRRRADNRETGPYPEPVRHLLGEMTAAAVLMQANIKFEGALVLQLHGEGPLKLAVVEVQSDLRLRSTAKTVGEVLPNMRFEDMVNQNNLGRCAITLDPVGRRPGQQPYQGVVALYDDYKQPLRKFSDVLAHYMLQSEQLDTILVLAANDQVAAGLLIQRLPKGGVANLSGMRSMAQEDDMGRNEDYNRIAVLANSLTADELLQLAPDKVLHRLFWQEQVRYFAPDPSQDSPRFVCGCHRDRVSAMIRSLGREEAESILAERGLIEVGCDFCGQQYRYDAVDAAQLFAGGQQPPLASTSVLQ